MPLIRSNKVQHPSPQAGFSLIAAIVALGIVVLLAQIMSQSNLQKLQTSHRTRALGEANDIVRFVGGKTDCTKTTQNLGSTPVGSPMLIYNSSGVTILPNTGYNMRTGSWTLTAYRELDGVIRLQGINGKYRNNDMFKTTAPLRCP